MRLVELIGKGAEILQYVAEKEPGTQLELRRHWSSRTVWKQIRRLQSQRLVVWRDEKYQATDAGLYNLVSHSLDPYRIGAPVKRYVKIAARKFPSGATMRVFGAMLKSVGKRNMKEQVMQFLEKPNALLFCRTDAEGQVAWIFWTTKRPENVRILIRRYGGWHRVHMPSNTQRT